MLWVSTSNDLRYDAVRDLADMAAEDIQVYPPVSSQGGWAQLPMSRDIAAYCCSASIPSCIPMSLPGPISLVSPHEGRIAVPNRQAVSM